MDPFNPKNWYYQSTDNRYFSTASMSEVPATDASLISWKALGLTPTPWPGNQQEADIRAALVAFDYPCGSISRRQFFQQCAVAGIISQSDAIAVLSNGTLPPALATIVNSLSADQQFGAKMILLGGGDFDRNHSLTIAIGTAQGMTSAQIDAFFQAAAQL